MADGDAVAAFLGTGTVNRQPASGVEEAISCIVKDAANDPINSYNGSTTLPILDSGVNTGTQDPTDATAASRRNYYNMGGVISNTTYLRKTGTTDTITVSGVQFNT